MITLYEMHANDSPFIICPQGLFLLDLKSFPVSREARTIGRRRIIGVLMCSQIAVFVRSRVILSCMSWTDPYSF